MISDTSPADFGSYSGCGRKLRPGQLKDYSSVLDNPRNSRLPQVLGLHQLSDVGQARLSDGGVAVQTVDVVLPLPLSPQSWGHAAALHCISDMYASGATPFMAVGIVEARSRTLQNRDLSIAYSAAVSTLNDEGLPVVGGHSLMGEVDKIGFAITGLSRSPSIRSVAHARVGDLLYLTKPIGSGALFAAMSAGERPAPQDIESAELWMLRSNRQASLVASEVGLSCTSDVSGYGLLGTCLQIANQSSVTVKIEYSRVPKMAGALSVIRTGIVSNLAEAVWLESREVVRSGVEIPSMLLLADPQVSGGLVLAVSHELRSRFESHCQRLKVPATRFGEVCERQTHDVAVVE